MSFGKLTCCAAVLCAALTQRASAQDSAVTFGEQPPLAVTGFAVGDAGYDRNLERGTAVAGKIALSLFRPWSDHLYLFGQLTTHLAPTDSGRVETHIDIDNLIINWTPPKVSALSLSFGRFDAPVGFERDDEPLNLVPTNSFTFEYARPVKLTGLLARYAVSPKVSVLGLVSNGWDVAVDNNSGKTAGLKFQVFPTTSLSIAAGALYGPEQDSTSSVKRTLLTGDFTWQPMTRLIVQGEAHHGSEQGTTWTGVVGQAFWRFSQSTGLTVRAEVFDDPNGARTGTAQTLSSVTISPWYFYREAQEGVFSNVEFTTFRLPAFSLRPALRFDSSSQPVFENKKSNVTALVELVYLF